MIATLSLSRMLILEEPSSGNPAVYSSPLRDPF